MKNTGYCIHENFRLTNIFAKPNYHCIAEIFGGINFRKCSKGHHIFDIMINTGQKNSPMRADGEISEKFLLAKISTYTVFKLVYLQAPARELDSLQGTPSSQ